ncbi:MAG: hypothetical protein QXN59_01745, partial [Candidatus Micrarchaeaceae archaeon]
TWVNNAEPVYTKSCSVYLFVQSCSSSGNSGYADLWEGQNDIVIGSNTFTLAAPNHVATVEAYSNGKYTAYPGNYYFYENGVTNAYWVPYCNISESGLSFTSCSPGSGYGFNFGFGSYTAKIYFGSAPNGLQWENSTILPYFLYNISVPATYSNLNSHAEYLNLSYDTYSPYNYLNPANALEPIPIRTGSGFFVNINGVLSVLPLNVTAVNNPYTPGIFYTPQSYFISDLTPETANSLHLGFLKGVLGNYSSAAVSSPSFIAASPNDYIYAINYTNVPSSCLGPLCIATTTDSYLYVMRFIPYGYFNVSNEQPDSVPYQPNSIAWNETWQRYWNESLAEQSANIYIVGVSNVSRVANGVFGVSGGFFGWGRSIVANSLKFNAIPTAITADDAGDVFFSGVDPNNGKLTIGYKLSNGTSSESYAEQVPKGFHVSDMLASDPGGQYLYLANSSYANITIYGSINATFTGLIPLNYSNSLNMLNISSYLAHGGPFGNSEIASAYANVPPSNDLSSYHHPVALADVGGIQYVIDNWTFTVNGLTSTILMLRAFAANGTEIKIDPQNYYDLIPANSASISVSTGNLGGALSNPPYGWPLSANISLPGGNYISYCAYGCTYTPSTMGPESYPPIASLVLANGQGADKYNFSTGINFNGTVYIISHPYALVKHISGGNVRGAHHSYITYTPENLYTELLAFQPKIVNYTSLSDMANSSYTCYIAPNTLVSSNSPCIIEDQYLGGSQSSEENVAWETISDMRGPILGVPSSFKYVESRGYPTAYIPAISALATIGSPFVSQSSSSSASSGSQNIISNSIYTSNSASSISPTSITLSSIPRTSLESNISGYILVPYKATFTLSEQWIPSPQGPSSSNGYSCPASYSFPSNVNQKYTEFAYAVSKVNSSTNTTAIEGGNIFLQYFSNGLYYSPNMSDAAAIMPPRIGYKTFTNRLIGEVYVNLTANTNGEVNPQMLINQTHIYNYYELAHYLDAFGSQVPAYYTQVAVPDNFSGDVGAVAGYYNPNNYLPKSNNFTLQSFSNVGGFVDLINAYHIVSTLDTLGLDMTGHRSILGYDRLIYNFVDRFGNKISMPLDADLSNITSISLSAVDNIDPSNSNQSTIVVNGFAGYVTGNVPVSVNPLPAGQKIYIYYDTNINFYPNKTYPSISSYAIYADRCAYGSDTQGCILANPANATQLSGNTVGSSPVYSLITYNPQYNSIGVCSKQPASLLTQQNYWECNIYGDYGLPETGTLPNGATEYCQPDFTNGTGQLTSQLGLVTIATTDSAGAFSANIPACGTGTVRIIAAYYGSPTPQPVVVQQVPLAYSANTTESANSLLYVSSDEYAYTFSPNQTIQSLPIGSYALSLGSIEVYALIAIAGFLVVFALLIGKRKQCPV